MDAAITAPITTRRGKGRATGSVVTSDDADYDQVHPLDGERTEPARDDTTAVPAAQPPTKRTRSVGANRHLTSLVLALVAVPVGYGFLDYASYRVIPFLRSSPDPDMVSDRLIIMLGAGAACFLVAALAGRISAMGPLVAGLIWGVGPAAWVILDYGSYIDRLNDLPNFWGHTGFGLAIFGIAIFPVVAGLLVGLGLAGKWRRPVPVSRW